MSHPLFQKSQHIACYIAKDDEFSTREIIEAIWQAKKQCYLPALSSQQEKFLEFVPYHQDDALQPNRYQILEPKTQAVREADELDLVIVPLIGFDAQGNRLGMGGGYYDRTFSFLLNKTKKTPYLLGLAYAMQEVAQLPNDPWDVPLTGMLTEKRLTALQSCCHPERSEGSD